MITSSNWKDFGYEEVKVIGRGQYGKAHLVRSHEDEKPFIAKTCELVCLSPKERDKALQEVTLLSRLDHPNIVEYYKNFFANDTLVIIMQYCEGGDLSSYIKEKGADKKRIKESQIMSFLVQILAALQYIHQERVLHRDLKSSNLFLMKRRSVIKLGDFGISRVLEGSEAAITVVGTPYYMSPEVCENKPYTYKSDVWSLGCVLYEMCMLKHAFCADNLLGLVYKIVSEEYDPIPRLYSQALNSLIQRMLEKDVENRPSTREIFDDSYVQNFMSEYVRSGGPFEGSDARASTRTGALIADRSCKALTGVAAVAASGTAAAVAGAIASSVGHQRPPLGNRAGSAARGSTASMETASTRASSSSSRPRAWGNLVGNLPSRERPPRRPGCGGLDETSGSSMLKLAAADTEAPRKLAQERQQKPAKGARVPAPPRETPQEAVTRRKREAADQKATELKAASKQAMRNNMLAKHFKEMVEVAKLDPAVIAAPVCIVDEERPSEAEAHHGALAAGRARGQAATSGRLMSRQPSRLDHNMTSSPVGLVPPEEELHLQTMRLDQAETVAAAAAAGIRLGIACGGRHPKRAKAPPTSKAGESASKPNGAWLPEADRCAERQRPPVPSEEVMEEISEADSVAEEYDDDFEDEICSDLCASANEEIDECSEIEELQFSSIDAGAVFPTVQGRGGGEKMSGLHAVSLRL